VVQEAITHGIRMSKGVESVLVTRQETIVLPRAKPIVAEGVHVAVKVRYSKLKLSQQNGSIVRGVLRDWSRGIHGVNRVPRPNFLCSTYYHQIGYQINECPFIENNVRQGFVKHF
jgi:hypothetical protein